MALILFTQTFVKTKACLCFIKLKAISPLLIFLEICSGILNIVWYVSGVGAILGGSRQCKRDATSLGHIWRSREGSTFRIRQVRLDRRRAEFLRESILIEMVLLGLTSCYYVSP